MPRGNRADARICVHEAAHIVAHNKLRTRRGFWLGTPHGASVEKIKGGYEGAVHVDSGEYAEWASIMLRDNPKRKAHQRETAELKAISLLAGQAAEHRRSRYSMEHAASFLFGCVGLLKYGYPSKDLRDAVALLKVYESNTARRNKWLRELCGRTCKYVWEWWPDIKRVAAFLQERRTLDRDGINEAYELIEGKEG